MTSKKKYKVLRGLNWPGVRAEPGEVRDDIPEKSVSWLLEDKAIEEYKPRKGEDK